MSDHSFTPWAGAGVALLAEGPEESGAAQPADDASTGIEVPPLTYTQLRLLAESAVSVNGGTAHFAFEPETVADPQTHTSSERPRLMRVASNEVPDDVVLVPSWHDARIAPLAQVGLHVAAPVAGQADSPRVNAVDKFADAVFWSDAAVQKFLFPYVASCGGGNAASVLARLQQAWNHYDPARVAVYGLMHVISHRLDTPLSLEKAIWVVFAPPGSEMLETRPLDAFLANEEWLQRWSPLPPAAPESGEPVPYARGAMDEIEAPRYPGYVELRGMAEYASSLRDTRWFVYRTGGAGFDDRAHDHLPEVQAGDVVIPVRTPAVPADRPTLGAVWFQPRAPAHEFEPHDIAHCADAVFWSTGAIEQFLFPYYASKLGFAAPEDLHRMRSTWNYVPPPEGAGAAAFVATAPGSTATTEGEEVYGLVHLPKSAWVTEQEAAAGEGTEALRATLSAGQLQILLRDDRQRKTRPAPYSLLLEIGVLHASPDGRMHLLSLGDFMVLYPGRFR